MASFISKTLRELLKNNDSLSHLTFILPSKRAGAFLKQEVSKLVQKPVFSPQVLSIEEFTEKISGLQTIDSVLSLFEFYEVYCAFTPKDQIEDFETFSQWGQTLLHDFNEIDRYLIPPEDIFNYLAQIQDLNHWSLQKEKTELVENYLAFWKKLPDYYSELKNRLLEKKQGYQGLVYRQAAKEVQGFPFSEASEYIFLGFNALNNAEQVIIQYMLEQGSQVFWDIDELHLNNTNHDASLFVGEYLKNWPYYKNHVFQFVDSSFSQSKEIEIIGVPKNIGQAKHVGEILGTLNSSQINNTAVVLGEESLLLPILNSIPQNLGALNITMGYPLSLSPLSPLFETLFSNFEVKNNRFYYKHVLSVLSNSIVQKAIPHQATKLIIKIKAENLTYLSKKEIVGFFETSGQELISLFFFEETPKPKKALQNFIAIISQLKPVLEEAKDPLLLEFLYQYHEVFKELIHLVGSFKHIKTIKTLFQFYKETSSSRTLDFQGKPFQGLQLMGMLESRVLDFETVILTSANEGILPSGKSNNSFIPYELKKNYNLPTYKEKDAIYTYHFYHLLQRAKKIYLLYNTDTDSLKGGEKSRLLTQLEIDKQPNHNINHTILTPKIPALNTSLASIKKTPEIIDKLKDLAKYGFSPSAITTYIRNPIDFYKKYILGIKEEENVEETIAHNTLGTIVHDTLEAFYTPLKGKEISLEHIENFKTRISSEVKKQFQQSYSKTAPSHGKNLLIFEVVQRYVLNFLEMERKEIEKGTVIKILEIETSLKTPIRVPGLDFPVYFKGKVDRVDRYNELLRIIDYKTGKVTQNQLEIIDWENLTSDYTKYAKPFQVLMYARMLLNSNKNNKAIAGVISFKNLSQGFLKFTQKDKSGKGAVKNTEITIETLQKFETQLHALLLEIFDPETAFNEKEIKKHYGNY